MARPFLVLRSLAVGALALGCASAAPSASAQPALREMSFGVTGFSAMSWPEVAAQQLGFFANNGLKVEIVTTGSAAGGAQQLSSGSLDISEVSAAAILEAIVGGAPIQAVIELSAKVPYEVVAKKGLTSIAQLKGKTIIIGGPSDITRIFMDKILGSAGLGPDDYTYTYAGATGERFAALVNGGVDATILFPPFSFRAADQGYPVLADVSKYFASFLFTTFAVQPAWARSHRDLVVAWTKAYLQGVRWLYNPANKARAIQILMQSTNANAGDAAAAYALFITKMRVFSPTGILSDEVIAPVLDALTKMGQLKPPVPPPARFYDNTYVEAANAQLRAGK